MLGLISNNKTPSWCKKMDPFNNNDIFTGVVLVLVFPLKPPLYIKKKEDTKL